MAASFETLDYQGVARDLSGRIEGTAMTKHRGINLSKTRQQSSPTVFGVLRLLGEGIDMQSTPSLLPAVVIGGREHSARKNS